MTSTIRGEREMDAKILALIKTDSNRRLMPADIAIADAYAKAIKTDDLVAVGKANSTNTKAYYDGRKKLNEHAEALGAVKAMFDRLPRGGLIDGCTKWSRWQESNFGAYDKNQRDYMTKIAKSEILRLRGEEPKKKEKKDYKTLALDLARMVLDGDRDSAEKLAQQITQNEKAENSAFSIQPSPAPPKPIKTLVFPKPVVAAVTSNIVSTSVIPPPATKVSCCGCGKSDAGLVPYDGKAYCAACLPVGAVSPIKRTLVVQPPKQKAKRALIANAGDSGCIVNNPAAVLSCGNSHA
jgi:hypothetical protein